jgi:peptidoglycan/xylan/chitin deacetylase (PgdA/CDA1 family)
MRPTVRALPPLALAFHGVADVPLRQDPQGLFVSPEELRRHLYRLRDWGYRLVTFGRLAELAADGRAGGHAALTFDDGLVDNLEALVPLLAEEDAPATVFVVSGWLGKPYPWGDWARIVTEEELRELAANGIEIGAHSRNHDDLSTFAYEQARADLEECKRDLEEMVGPVETAAYPFGRANDETIRACRDAGFRGACRISGEGSWSDPHNLPRQDMLNHSSALGLRLKRDDLYEPLMRFPPARAARKASRALKGLAQ